VIARRALATLFALALGAACTGTTGSALVAFPAYVAGPPDASETQSLAFTSGRGWDVVLDLAVLHVGGVYLNRSLPISGAQATSCTLPALYVAEVSGGKDIDVLSPRLQPLPALGEGTESPALAGEVWLTSGDVNAGDDATPIVQVHGIAARGGVSREFRGVLTIGKNRAVPARDPAQPGANPICKQRIVSPIPIRITPREGGALVVRVDPRAWFANVDFSALEADESGVYAFRDDSGDQPSIALFQSVRGSSGVYDFAWLPQAP